ncbi:hypothetical protein HOM50_02375 [bacterium]|nr:hypothetical protein [bacterium]
MKNIAINGFGRIGKNFLRVLFQDPQALKELKPVAINIGPCDVSHTAYSFKYDTLLGTFKGDVTMEGDFLVINNHKIKIVRSLDPAELDWKALDIDWVVEASGQFTKRNLAQKHLNAGAKNILITAPATDEDVTIIPGVNHDCYKPGEHHIVSLGSCTTNALAPMLKVLHDNFEIQNAIFTTIHSYTNSQVLLDVEKKEIRNSRAAALNCIPTTTGASKVIGKILPELDGKTIGSAVRIPLAKVSLLDVVFTTEKNIDPTIINQAFENASTQDLQNILSINHEPLVSSDYNESNESIVIDGLLTQAQGNMGKVSGWYDNEWAYCQRLKDFLLSTP